MEAQEISRLVEEARQGNIAAFQTLYEYYVKRIYNFLLRLLGSVHEAEDLTQQTFVVAFQQVGTLRDAAQIESWIYRIARNEAYQRFRRKNPESIDDRKFATGVLRLQEERLHTQPEKNLLNVELSGVIQKALDALPDKLREVFVLAVIQEMSYQEITEVVGRSLDSVKTDIYRARLQIKEELRRYTGVRTASGTKGKIQ